MTQLIGLFFGSIVAGALMAPALALLGAQIVAREKAVQALFVGQAAVVAALGVAALSGLTFLGRFLAMILTIGLVWGADVGGRALKRRLQPATWYCGLLVICLVTQSLMIALYPGLEAHYARVFFSDLATLNTGEQWLVGALAALAGAFLLARWRALTASGFDDVVLGLDVRHGWLALGGAALVSLWVQLVGFLFTAGSLLVPHVGVMLGGVSGLRAYTGVLVTSAALGTVGGFLAALYWPWLPTTPIIVASQGALAVALSLTWTRLLRRPAGQRDQGVEALHRITVQ